MAERINLIHDPENKISTEDKSYGQLKAECLMHSTLHEEISGDTLTHEKIQKLKSQLTSDFISIATDLSTLGLAEGHVNRLIDHLLISGARSEIDLYNEGFKEFYKISKDIFGPLWASYVNLVFENSKGGETFLFAARDATPMYWAAKGLLSIKNYHLEDSKLVHVDWNRWFMGQEDETDDGRSPLPLEHPLMKKFYEQMGFGNDSLVKIVEPGAWGSAANALKTQMPDQKFELWFMFSHMPDKIFGFLNTFAPETDPKIFEMINDSQEAVPKSYVRPEELIMVNGRVVADISDKLVDSPFMKYWTKAVALGAFDAGVEFAKGNKIPAKEQVAKIAELSRLSREENAWTGVLPNNTMTWTEGKNWKKNWKWGKIPPLS